MTSLSLASLEVTTTSPRTPTLVREPPAPVEFACAGPAGEPAWLQDPATRWAPTRHALLRRSATDTDVALYDSPGREGAIGADICGHIADACRLPPEPRRGRDVRSPGLRADRRVRRRGAHSHADPGLVTEQYRSRLDQRDLLCGLHAGRPAAVVADRSGGSQAHLPRVRRALRAVRERRCSISDRSCAIGRRSPTHSPTVSTPGRCRPCEHGSSRSSRSRPLRVPPARG